MPTFLPGGWLAGVPNAVWPLDAWSSVQIKKSPQDGGIITDEETLRA
jgi:hypothetical protein